MSDCLPGHELRDLVAKASTLHERVRGSVVSLPGSDAEGRARLRLWSDALVKGDEASFRRRLQWDQLDEARLRPLLGSVRLREDAPLPSWTGVLQAALAEARDAPLTESFVDAAAPFPFEQLLVPFVLVARKRLAVRVGAAADRLAQSARRTLERELLEALAHHAARALHLEFSVHRAQSLSTLERMQLEADAHPGREVYAGFVERMKQGGLAAFFQEYAVLARQLSVMSELWVNATAEFVERLDRDWPELAAAFASGAPPAAVERIAAKLSDPHAGRRRVLALTFDTGDKVVYKPRAIDVEAAFHDLVRWLNARAGLLPMQALRVVERDGYGWVELAEHAECADREAAGRYFERAGMLLCLVYVLEGVDCHRDNVIARGEQPLLVDCEGLMQPRQHVEDMADDVLVRFLAQEQLSHSVLRTGMLPFFQARGPDGNGKVYDISALGGFHDEEEEVRRLVWSQTNTDAMELGLRTVSVRVPASGPMLEGRSLGLAAFLDEVTRGFRAMYDALARLREPLLAPDGPLARLSRAPVRYIFRDTQTYALLSRQLCVPEHQRDGVSRGIQLDLLCRPHIPPAPMIEQQTDAPGWWPVFGAEVRAMQSEDIPYFGVRPTANALLVPPAEELRGLFQGPSFELVKQRLRGLDEVDRERQVGYVAASLYGGVSRGARPVQPSAAPEVARAPSDDELVGEAMRLAEQIAASAVRVNGNATWVAPQFVFRSERYLLSSLQHDLYTGRCGVALFLAAASRAGGAPELEELARDTVRSLRAELASAGPPLADLIGLGGTTGVGSIVYSLTHLGRTLGDADLLEDARRASELITPERIAADHTLDVCDGVAGALIALLTLHDVTGDPELVERAEACARHLVGAVVRDASGRAGWVTILDTVMVGMSHGIAGIAYALLRLYGTTGDDSLRQLAQDALAYEDALFDATAGNWPDLRLGPDAFNTAAWCHGGAGITLARLGASQALDDEIISRDIDAGVDLLLGRELYDVDFACCGNVGLHDILLTASQQLDRSDLRDAGLGRLWQVVLRARQEGAYALDPALPRQILNPTFFQGLAGIGYTLLRFGGSQLPPVLLLV